MADKEKMFELYATLKRCSDSLMEIERLCRRAEHFGQVDLEDIREIKKQAIIGSRGEDGI